MCKHWTEEEINYIKTNWGDVSIPHIAKSLKRSVGSIRQKAYKIGLRDMIHNGEYITLHQFAIMLNNREFGSYMKKLENAGFPLSYQKIINKNVKVIYMEEFWRWFKKNKHVIDLSKTENGCFGYEPDWVDIKRFADKRAAEYIKTPWTKAEDEYLLRLLRQYKYGYREISIKLKRTEGAIKRRVIDLKTKMRPIKADTHTAWTEQELKIVKDMYLKGFKSCIIAEHINRSALAINGILEKNNYFKGVKNV